MLVGVTVTNLQEATLALQHGGIDVFIAQGVEAGGHRGCFDPNYGQDDIAFEQTWLPTAQLVQHLCQIPDMLPIVAAGGIMNGRDIQQMLQYGAAAVQMGTIFLNCHESTASPAHKRIVNEQGGGRSSIMTRAFSGRLARGLSNEYIARFNAAQAQSLVQPLPFPHCKTHSQVQ